MTSIPKPCRGTAGRRLAGAVAVLFALAFAATADGKDPTVLTEKANAAMERGLAAAKQREWPIAIRYFEEAQHESPEAPPLLFNLGLAQDRLGGRELVVIAWYRAYLASAPKARNGDAVRKRIIDLEILTEAKATKLVGMARRIAGQLPPDSGASQSAFKDVVVARAETGDIAGALAEAEKTHDRDSAFSSIAGLQARSGDIAGAKRTASRINDAPTGTFRDIAYAQADQGDFRGASQTAAAIPNLIRSEGHSNVVELARQIALFHQAEAFGGIASRQIAAGDRKGARAALALQEKALYAVTHDSLQVQIEAVFGGLSESYSRIGDFANARRVAGDMPNQIGFRDGAYATLAVALAEAGDIKSAQRATANVEKEEFQRNNALEALNDALERKRETGDAALVREPKSETKSPPVYVQKDEVKDWTYAARISFSYPLYQDFPGFLESLQGIVVDDDDIRFSSLDTAGGVKIEKMIGVLLAAAKDLSGSLQRVRRMEDDWRMKRGA